MIVSLLLLAATLVTPVKPLPKANPVPFAEDTQAVMAPVQALLAAVAARDGAAALAQVQPEGLVTASREAADGTRTVKHMKWTDFAAGMKPGADRYQERLTDPAIEVDGDIAMVWSPYVFVINGAVHHCGVDHFDLVRESGAWKVLNITWSQRTAECEVGR